VFLDLRQRVARFLLLRASADPPIGRSTLTQAEVAASIGASRQRVNACLREFEKLGWISLASRRLRVLDGEALASVVNP
jgi:CRP-like cAMP-binding protein